MNSHISQFHAYASIWPCHNFNAGLGNLCRSKVSLVNVSIPRHITVSDGHILSRKWLWDSPSPGNSKVNSTTMWPSLIFREGEDWFFKQTIFPCLILLFLSRHTFPSLICGMIIVYIYNSVPIATVCVSLERKLRMKRADNANLSATNQNEIRMSPLPDIFHLISDRVPVVSKPRPVV